MQRETRKGSFRGGKSLLRKTDDRMEIDLSLLKKGGDVCRTQSGEYENFLENQKCLGVGKLPGRSNLLHAKHKGVYYRNKEESERLCSLNGTWRFAYRESDCIPDFYAESYDDSSWDTIDVPSVWQYRGYGKCTYPNVRYPIPFDPPHVRCVNPVGYYRRSFTGDPGCKNAILHFGGVDNAFFVYVNGEFAGFSKGSRIPAEFDVTRFLHDGENTLAVKVFTYSDATYLENQDMLLANGIFRDVYLLFLDECYIRDYRVFSHEDGFTVEIAPEYGKLEGDLSEYTVVCELDGQSMCLALSGKMSCRFFIEDLKKWNAEEPNLYLLDLVLCKGNEIVEVHSKKIGYCHTEVAGNKFLVNGMPVYIKGVNRHEYDCKNGRAISTELIEKELRDIKNANLNAIRTSHYTNNPAFYELCSEMGIYVMDEADIETHGAQVTDDQGYLSKMPEWYDAYLDRVTRMLEGEKNEPCVFLWSIGNECGRGENLDRCAEFIRKFDPTREVLNVQSDGISRFGLAGYPPMEKIRAFPEDGKPVLMVEYAHAMGNSPGNLEGYWDYVYTHENMVGGFVWEYKNHGFYTEDRDGKPGYLYGGDFGDYVHWANFVLDGYHTSDGTPKPTWNELREVSSPVYARVEDGHILLKNTCDFLPLCGIVCKWRLLEDHTVLRSGSLPVPALLPHKEGELVIDYGELPKDGGARFYLTLDFYKGDTRLSTYSVSAGRNKAEKKLSFGKYSPKASGNAEHAVIEGEGFAIEFKNGLISRLCYEGLCNFDPKMKLNFYRAPTDNDGIANFKRRMISKWNKVFLKQFTFLPAALCAEREDDGVILTFTGKCAPAASFSGFDVTLKYRIMKGGAVTVTFTGAPYGKMPETLPRIGVCFDMPKQFTDVKWYGLGEDQSYADAKRGVFPGLYEKSADGLNFLYDYPQETGNREGTFFVLLEDGKTEKKLAAASSEPFAFSYHPFTMDALIRAQHRNELYEDESCNHLYIDYRMRPLGSNSCGPQPEPEFELRPHSFRFVFTLFCAEKESEALDVVRSDYEDKTETLSGPFGSEERYLRGIEYADCDVE